LSRAWKQEGGGKKTDKKEKWKKKRKRQRKEHQGKKKKESWWGTTRRLGEENRKERGGSGGGRSYYPPGKKEGKDGFVAGEKVMRGSKERQTTRGAETGTLHKKQRVSGKKHVPGSTAPMSHKTGGQRICAAPKRAPLIHASTKHHP